MKGSMMSKEEKLLLKELMEKDEMSRKMQFFRGMNWDIPPAETFMVGEPEPYNGKDLFWD